MELTAPHIWQLRRGADKRFRAGHPWVYSNELAHSPSAVAPGDPVELRDAAGRFLARGYGHPGTLIAFRALCGDPAQVQPWGEAGLLGCLQRAAALRRAVGLGALSQRWIFGEADGLPGLIVDRYRLASPASAHAPPVQALVLQQHTAGAERLHGALLAALERWVREAHAAEPAQPSWERTALVLRNDVSARRLEGLRDDEARVLREVSGVDLRSAGLRVAAPWDAARDDDAAPGVLLRADLVGGQKTGLYLDQSANVRLVAGLLAARLQDHWRTSGSTTGSTTGSTDVPSLRILDLFSYVGQWGAQLARVAARATAGGDGAAHVPAHVTVLDTSAPALEFAAANIAAAGGACEPLRADVMEVLPRLPARAYDVVVADPPAFIKSRKAFPTGRAAYVKLNAGALRLVRPGGLFVTCSCSRLLDEAEFLAVLDKAAVRAGTPLRWLARGGQGPDHPVPAGFPEGRYLKCWVGVVG